LGNLAVANKDPTLFDVAERIINATISPMTTGGIPKESCDSATGATLCDVDQQIFKVNLEQQFPKMVFSTNFQLLYSH
jgi:hypothetical protein